jgi:hypothetical protein
MYPHTTKMVCSLLIIFYFLFSPAKMLERSIVLSSNNIYVAAAKILYKILLRSYFFNIPSSYDKNLKRIGVQMSILRLQTNYRTKTNFNYEIRMFINQSISEIDTFHLVTISQDRTKFNKTVNICKIRVQV